MLGVWGLHTGYGETQVVRGVNLSVAQGTVHALLGRNGVGKTTTLRAIMGLLPAFQGNVTVDGVDVTAAPPHARARRGLQYVPETRDVFGALSVMENLRLAERLSGSGGLWTLPRVFELFPNLAERRGNGGNQLSGGEQQMLAIARALVANPRVLMLDEPTEGLAPILVRQILDALGELKRAGMTMVLVEQNVAFASVLADEITLMGRGAPVWTGTPDALRTDEELHRRWLGV